jgi:NAD+ synthase (glutamine-hydrolysing)
MRALGVSIKEIDIKAACTQHFKDIGHDASIHDTTYENTQARNVLKFQMDYANTNQALVVGTGDLSELLWAGPPIW